MINDALRALIVLPRRFRHGGFAVGATIVGIVVIAALIGPALVPHDPFAQDLLKRLVPPVWMEGSDPGFLLGTDDLGRDVLSRLIFGSRIALTVAFIAAGLAALIGTLLGLLAGWYGGWTDKLISRLVDIWMAFPPVLLSILLVAVFGSGVHSVIAAIVIID